MQTILLPEPGSILDSPLGPLVVAIGMFDGVHRGHRVVIAQALAIARERGLKAAAFTFVDPPRRILKPAEPVMQLTTWPEKRELLGSLGLDVVVGASFSRAFSQLGAEEFVETVLHDQLGARHVVVGYNFCFGRGQSGDVGTLREQGGRYDFGLSVVAPVEEGGLPVSSSRIRRLLLDGDLAGANALLGQPYRLNGPVVEGDRRGRTLGYPTANLDVASDKLLPAFGVYAGWALWAGRRQPCVINLGVRPTFRGTELRLEAHLLDFAGDLYGQEMTLELVARLRGERAFASVDELVAQIRRDAAEAGARLVVPGR